MSESSRSHCRACDAPLERLFADLGASPLANSYLDAAQLNAMEPHFPLRAFVCDQCLLVQLEDYETPETIFTEYAYFSSYSTSWLEHSRRYAEAAVPKLGLDASKLVVELASNDGYLLQYFAAAGSRCSASSRPRTWRGSPTQRGIPTIVEFFGVRLADELRAESSADLLIGNNVLAHVPDLNDFVAGMRILLKPGGTINMEFPHLLELIDAVEFDTIYHEHFSYFSLLSVGAVFERHGLRIFDVELLSTHGGSLRIHACHVDDERPEAPSIATLLERERAAGLDDVATYADFAERVRVEKRALLRLLIGLKEEGMSIAGYGAPAKAATLLNYCGIGTDMLDFTVDRNPNKQGHFIPGARIPVLDPEEIARRRPEVIVILPWNLRDEIVEQLSFVRDWGGRFVVRVPRLELF